MSDLESMRDRIRAYARHRGWGRYRLAVEAGLAKNTCRYMDQPDWNPRYETLQKLEQLIPPGWRPPPEEEPERPDEAA